MRRSQKRQMPPTPRNSVNVEALLEGSSGGEESATNNAGRTQRRPKTRAMEPVGNPSSMVLRSASAASLASVVAPAPQVVARAPPGAAPAPPVRRGLHSLAPSSTMSDSGLGSVSSCFGKASQAGSDDEIGRIIITQGRSQRKLGVASALWVNIKKKIVKGPIQFQKKGGLEILFGKPKKGESSDNSMDSNENSEEGWLESDNDSEADGRGDGEGAVSVA